jgi:hypothetical protein
MAQSLKSQVVTFVSDWSFAIGELRTSPDERLDSPKFAVLYNYISYDFKMVVKADKEKTSGQYFLSIGLIRKNWSIS